MLRKMEENYQLKKLQNLSGRPTNWLGGHAATLEHGEGDGEDERVEESVNGLEDRDVLDEGGVPQKSNYENVDEDDDEEDDQPLEEAGCALYVKKVLDHFNIGK